MERYTRKYSGYATPRSGQEPVRERDYVAEPYRNNQVNYKGEAKGAMPQDDEEFIPAREEMVRTHKPDDQL